MEIELGWAQALHTLAADPRDCAAREWADKAVSAGRGTPGQLYAYRVVTSGQDLFTALADAPARVADVLARHETTPDGDQPLPGEWSPRQIVHHLADNEAVNAVRLRSILTEESPEVFGYDSETWTRFFDVESTAQALHRFTVQRDNTVRVLRGLTPGELERTGVLSYRGAETVRVLAAVLAGHDLSHLDQLAKSYDLLEETPQWASPPLRTRS
jgi:hypothetical protein